MKDFKKSFKTLLSGVFVIMIVLLSVKVEAKTYSCKDLGEGTYITTYDSKGITISKNYIKIKKMKVTPPRTHMIIAKGKFKLKLSKKCKYYDMINDKNISKKKAIKILKKSPERLYGITINKKMKVSCIAIFKEDYSY